MNAAMLALAAGCGVFAAVLLGVPLRTPVPADRRVLVPTATSDRPARRARRRAWSWGGLAGAGVWGLVGGPVGAVIGLGAAMLVAGVLLRTEDPVERRAREAAGRDLSHLVGLLASALRSGAAPATALAVVCAALPGAAADRLAGARRMLELGSTPEQAWAELTDDPVLAPLGRALGRAAASGAPVALTLDRLSDELAAEARAAVEDRARAVGVRAAVPLGLCLLPAFLLIGVVPMVGGLAGELLP